MKSRRNGIQKSGIHILDCDDVLDIWIRCPNKMMHIRSGRLWRLSLSSLLLGGGRLRAIYFGLQWEIY